MRTSIGFLFCEMGSVELPVPLRNVEAVSSQPSGLWCVIWPAIRSYRLGGRGTSWATFTEARVLTPDGGAARPHREESTAAGFVIGEGDAYKCGNGQSIAC
jgi:hypothetical protein